MRFAVVGLVLVCLIGGAGWYWHSSGAPTVEYKTSGVRKGDVVDSISATGTLEPEESVDVGAQVAGQIVQLGKDANGTTMDWRSPVEAGMLLAKIDDTVYKADRDVAAAELAQAQTSIQKGEADLAQANSKLMQAEHNWDRARTLGPSDALSQNDYDMYQADFESAKANVAIAQAEVAQAKNGVPLAQADLDKAEQNVRFCTINSPVKGTIIDRRVNIGQTVVSSLNTPSLFFIARDLSKMQIWASVNEADVSRVTPGAPITFTTDTFPGRIFPGKVDKVRWNAQMSQNVVLYTVVVDVENPDRILFPYLTAKVQFEVAKASQSLIVPNLALRWEPASPLQISTDARAAWKHGQDTADPEAIHHGTAWVKDGDFVRPIAVKTGVTDRVDTAIETKDLAEGDQVVTGDIPIGGDSSQKNPFMPPMQKRGR